MTLDHKGGPSRDRRPSFRRSVYYKVVNGKEVVAAMPRGRKRSLKAITKEQNDDFRQANYATKYWAPHLQAAYAQAVKGTPLMPRDLMIMVMYNRFAMITLSDGRKLYPMTAVLDVSQSLDVIGQTPGDLLVRGGQHWIPIGIGTPGQFLAVDPTGQFLEWTSEPPPTTKGDCDGDSISTNQTCNSTAYQDLATAGPSVTLDVNTAVLVTISTLLTKPTNQQGFNAFMSFALSGANTLASNDANSVNISYTLGAGGYVFSMSRQVKLTGLTPGSTTFKAQYRKNGGNDWDFNNRTISVLNLD